MANSYYCSFYDLFNNPIVDKDGNEMVINTIIIPIIQRDYAQGRTSPEVVRIREKFLTTISESLVNNEKLNLDFVYGDIDENGNLTPLDGQQRLTTLFLLHWYAAKKDKVDYLQYKFLNNFSYETRASSRDFCKELVKFNFDSTNEKLSETIINESWFPLDWKNDQTISSMLVMIDCINEKFKKIDNLWDKITNINPITFYFLPIKGLGLSDELYIKMNSRGKPLTRFEHFKAELEAQLNSYDNEYGKIIAKKIDQNWTDMLWEYRDNNQIDNLFLNLFKFICDLICYKEGNSTSNRSYDEFDLIDLYFSTSSMNLKEHIDLFQNIFDAFSMYNGKTNELFSKFLSKEHELNKTKVYGLTDLDLFQDCLYNYMDKDSIRRSRSFPLSKFTLFYAFVVYVLNKNEITENQMIERIRVINNLIDNSTDEIGSDSENREGGNRLPAVIKQIESIIKNGIILELNVLGINFNKEQLIEEKEKFDWRKNNQKYINDLNELEDNEIIHGQMSIIELNKPNRFKKFIELFSCDLDKINCTLLTVGNYYRIENGWRYLLGTKSKEYAFNVWRDILHKSRAANFDQTKEILNKFLDDNATFTNSNLDVIIDNFLKECENKSLFDWRYYFIKYESFRPDRYGKYFIKANTNNYEIMTIYAKSYTSQNSYQPFLYEINKNLLDRDKYGERLIIGDNYLYCEKNGYFLRDKDNNIIKSLLINQNSDMIDTEDRILKYKSNPIQL